LTGLSSNWTCVLADQLFTVVFLDSSQSIQYGPTKLLTDLDSRLAYPRPRPRSRLSSFKTKTKTLMSKTKTETQDLQDQYWKSMTGINCNK